MEVVGGRVNLVEIKDTVNGKQFLKFSVVENKGYKENKTATWYDCTSWDTNLNLSTGSMVLLFGHSNVRTWNDKNTGEEKKANGFEVYHCLVLNPNQAASKPPAVPTKKLPQHEDVPF